jgi:hypothetical protein
MNSEKNLVMMTDWNLMTERLNRTQTGKLIGMAKRTGNLMVTQIEKNLAIATGNY